ncbi:MAG: S-layer homology domain-containing protein, partial [Oscillospiraceae bacterium]|nr:S-layer homology domain-containing protein [Oscillospiraceae bacterium]
PLKLQNQYTSDITRAEFCALAAAIYEAHTGKTITERKTFTDTDDPNVEKMAGLGVVTGGGDGTFDPNGTFNREMAAVLLANLLKALDIELEKSETTFADRGAVSGWALEGVGQVQKAGLIQGSGGNFNPKGKFTREAGIMLMLNLWDYLKK